MGLTQITTGGVDDNINIDSNTLKVDGTNNRVGINTASPTTKLEINGGTDNNIVRIVSTDANANIEFADNTTTSGCQIGANGDNLKFGISGTERMRIDSSGNVQVSTGQFTVGTTASTGLQFINDGTFGTINSADLKFRTASAERMRIDSSGRLLVGTTSAINSGYTGGSIHLRNNAGGVVVFKRNDGNVTNSLGILEFHSSFGRAASIVVNNEANHTGSSTPGTIVFSTTPTGTFNTPAERMRIDSSGRVMIGTSTNNGGFLTVDSGGTQNVVIRDNGIENHKYNGTAEIAINYNGYLNGAGHFRNFRIYNGKAQLIAGFDGSTRSLGVGTSSPRGLVHLHSSSAPRLDFTNSATGTGSSDGTTISVDGSSGALNIIQRESQPIQFYTGNTERMRLDSSGNLNVGVTAASPQHQSRVFVNTTADSQHTQILTNGNLSNNFGKYFEASGKSFVRNLSERNIDLVQGVNAGSNINVLVKVEMMVVCATDDEAGTVVGYAGYHRAGGGTNFWTNTPSMTHHKGSGMGTGTLSWVGGDSVEKILRYATDSNRNYTRYIITRLVVVGHDYAPVKIL